jgi:hypothetical protein
MQIIKDMTIQAKICDERFAFNWQISWTYYTCHIESIFHFVLLQQQWHFLDVLLPAGGV